MKINNLVLVNIAFLVLIIILILIFFSLRTPENLSDEEQNLTSMELDNLILFFDFCLNSSLTIDESVLICRDTNVLPFPSLHNVEQLIKMQNLSGQRVLLFEDQMNDYSISEMLNSSCDKLWELQYASLVVRPTINTVRIDSCKNNNLFEKYDHYLTKDAYIVPAKTSGTIFKISDRDLPQLLYAIN